MGIASPADGGVLTIQPWVPLAVRLPRRALDAPATLTLDGQPWSDPLALYHRRAAVAGTGVDYLATLDLTALNPGDHTLTFDATPDKGAPVHSSSRFHYLRPPDRLQIHVVDGADLPTPARIAVWDGDGPLPLLLGPNAAAADPMGRDTQLHSVFALHGEAVLYLNPGHYRFAALHSLRDDVGVAEIDLAGPADLTLRVPELVPTPGWLTADLHVHTARSGDAFVPNWGRFASLIAAGLDIAVISDHERIIDPTLPLATLLAGADGTRGVTGIEVRTAPKRTKDGHMNAFPLVAGPTWQGERSVASLVDAYRAMAAANPVPGAGGKVILQLNHPRGIQFSPQDEPLKGAHAQFTLSGFDHKVPPGVGANAWMLVPQPGTGTTALDFNALEIINRFSWTLYQAVRGDWFALLDDGYVFTGTGNSDSHALAVEAAGLPVNFVAMPRPAPGAPLDQGALVDAIAAGNVTVSNGPVVEMYVSPSDGTKATVGPGDLLATSELVVHARVRAAPWVPVPELRLVVDGVVVQRQKIPAPPAGQITDASADWPVQMATDGWLLVEAGWPLDDKKPVLTGLYAELAPGHVPTGFTNPVRVDADGDGRWVPKGRRAGN